MEKRILISYKIDDVALDTLLFADDQVLLAETENDLQRGLFTLNNIANEYNLKISSIKTKVMAFRGQETVRAKIILYDKVIDQISEFTYLGCYLLYMTNNKVSI